jgi:hypothetical protein
MRRLFCFQIIGFKGAKLIIDKLKIIVVALVIGTVFTICAQTKNVSNAQHQT